MIEPAPSLKTFTGSAGSKRKITVPDWKSMLLLLLASVMAVIWLYPFLWMLSASLKQSLEIFSSGLNLFPKELRWNNYGKAWEQAGFNRYLLNSVLVTTGTTALALFQTALTGYAIGRYKFIGKKLVIGVLVGTLFVPTGYTVIPQVQIAQNLGLLNSLLGMILVMGAAGHTTAILLFSGFFNRIPKELEEAAILDGAGFVKIFWYVMLPLATPVIATVTLLTYLGAWNNFFIPLVFTFSRPELRTLSVGMLAFVGQNETDWSGMAAGATIALLPIMLLFLFLQRYYIEGVAGAVKG